MTIGRTVVVPVLNPETAPERCRMAAHLARPDQGMVVPLAVRLPDDDGRVHGHSVAVGEEAAREEGVAARGRVVAATTIADGVIEGLESDDATLTLMGWAGQSTKDNVFGTIIDTVLGRSLTPLAVLRPLRRPVRRVLLPVSPDHLLGGGERGLKLAVELATRLRDGYGVPAAVLRTGKEAFELPGVLHDLAAVVHDDSRRVDQAVGAMARPDDLIVTPVAPTTTGLRTATTHLAWAVEESGLMVAIDVGEPPARRLRGAVAQAGASGRGTALEDAAAAPPDLRIVVRVTLTALNPQPTTAAVFRRALSQVAAVQELVEVTDEQALEVHAVVLCHAPSTNVALASLMTALDDEREALGRTQIAYTVESDTRAPTGTNQRP